MLERRVLNLRSHLQNRLPRLLMGTTEPQAGPHAAAVGVPEHGLGPNELVWRRETNAPRVGALKISEHRRGSSHNGCPRGPHIADGSAPRSAFKPASRLHTTRLRGDVRLRMSCGWSGDGG